MMVIPCSSLCPYSVISTLDCTTANTHGTVISFCEKLSLFYKINVSVPCHLVTYWPGLWVRCLNEEFSCEAAYFNNSEALYFLIKKVTLCFLNIFEPTVVNNYMTPAGALPWLTVE